jgi:hypothetical protein
MVAKTRRVKWTRDPMGVYRACDDRLRIEQTSAGWELQIKGDVVGMYRTLRGAKGPANDHAVEMGWA